MPTVEQLRSRAVILVKALPQPSRRYGETVCCAGVTAEGHWKRLFPVRFRHLNGDSSFGRWDWVKFSFRPPTTDLRHESCHVYEDTIVPDGHLRPKERSRLLTPLVKASGIEAAAAGHSLALIRPRETKFYFRKKTEENLTEEREAYRQAAKQTSFFDKELAELEPTPFEFRFKFTDGSGKHDYLNGDWETHTMFWRWRKQHGEDETLRLMQDKFNNEFPQKGMVFAIGNQARRPQTWQLLGVIRLDEAAQGELFC